MIKTKVLLFLTSTFLILSLIGNALAIHYFTKDVHFVFKDSNGGLTLIPQYSEYYTASSFYISGTYVEFYDLNIDGIYMPYFYFSSYNANVTISRFLHDGRTVLFVNGSGNVLIIFTPPKIPSQVIDYTINRRLVKVGRYEHVVLYDYVWYWDGKKIYIKLPIHSVHKIVIVYTIKTEAIEITPPKVEKPKVIEYTRPLEIVSTETLYTLLLILLVIAIAILVYKKVRS